MRWLTTTIHVLVIGCAVSIPVAIFNGTLFSWHPTLMAVAFLGFMAEGVLTSVSFRSLVGSLPCYHCQSTPAQKSYLNCC